MKSGNRPHKIAIQRPGAPYDDGYTSVPGALLCNHRVYSC